MYTLGIFTTTRAEFGILSALINKIIQDESLNYNLFVGGSHLKKDQGLTIKEINKFDFKISRKFDYLQDGDNALSLAKSMGQAVDQVAKIFEEFQFDFTLVLGDRIELLTIILNSILFGIPIIHIHGGEKTEGAVDEQVRHMITKAAHIHFASCKEYAENIKKMGESGWRVYNTGALSIDNIKNLSKIDKKTLFLELGLNIKKPVIIATYHPSHLEREIDILSQMNNIFTALKAFDLQVIITAPGIEIGSHKADTYIRNFVAQNSQFSYHESLGVHRYYSLLEYCAFVIGNSSSGINEVPFFRIPTINIGTRQRGRLRHPSVIDTDYNMDSIKSGIVKAMSKDFSLTIQDQAFKFGDGTAAENMVSIIKALKKDSSLMAKKLDFSEYTL